MAQKKNTAEKQIVEANIMSIEADRTIENYTYSKKLNPEEILSEKESLSQIAIKIQDLEEEKAEILEGFKGQIKPLSQSFGIVRGNIKSGSKKVTETVYVYYDRSDSTARIVSVDGVIIDTRPMTADELQIKLYSDNE